MLLDRFDGGVAVLVETQATLTSEEAAGRARAALDGYAGHTPRTGSTDGERRTGPAHGFG